MAITLNFTSITDCNVAADVIDDPATDLTGSIGTIGLSPAAEYQPGRRRGTDCIEFFCSGSGTCGVHTNTTITAFSIRTNEVGFWFLNPLLDADDARLLGNADADLRLRVYSGSNWADYYQPHLKGRDGEYPGGWMYLTASGAAGSEDNNSGTWTNTQADSIDAISIIFNCLVGTSSLKDAAFACDWALYYDKIEVDGYNGGTTPWTLDDIYTTAVTFASGGGIWGCVQKSGNFFSVSAQLEFGDGVAAGAFSAKNEYLNLIPTSAEFDLDITIENLFTVTLGTKNVGSDGTYAQDGVIIDCNENGRYTLTTPAKCAPTFLVKNGGVLNAYASLIKRFGTVSLGELLTGTTTMELIGCDLYDNDEIELRSTGLTLLNVKMHFDGADKGDIGVVYRIPASLEGIDVFQCTDALAFRVTTDVDRYRARDATAHVVILEANTVSLINSTFDPTKLKRLAS